MQLSKKILKDIQPVAGLTVPATSVFDMPEKVLQFGTGVLLRGLPDYFIDKANRLGVFNGRIVVVKSTSSGSTDAFTKQDGLYTLWVKGIENGDETDEKIIHSCISRVICAQDNWDMVLECAANPDIKIIISNTTEVGISLMEDDIRMSPPFSFPGKLLGFLYERYKCFRGSMDSGMVIVPTELITDNGTRLRSILLQLAKMNKLEDAFLQWLLAANRFCNSLVDRIVPGKLPEHELEAVEKAVGYTDELMIMSEPFRLWAIESADAEVKEILSFWKADKGIVIADNIEKYRELKLRLLNGTHSFSCALAHLCGFETVKEAMADANFFDFVEELALKEISYAIESDLITASDTNDFATNVLERFCNPFLEHKWLSISAQYSSKMRLRNVPILLRHYARSVSIPEKMALGFAAYIVFMNCREDEAGGYKGTWNDQDYPVQDEHAHKLADIWQQTEKDRVAGMVLCKEELWGADLDALPGFTNAVQYFIDSILKYGAMETISKMIIKKTEV